jgi:hypothetical protein
MKERLETGILKPKDDWPGIFIRGDDALMYAHRLRSLFAALEARAKSGAISLEEASACVGLSELADLLDSCRSSRRSK